MNLIIPQRLRDNQRQASDPGMSVWVAANAGSGKTHVLTQRVIRLLLGGVAPSKILCLTFTKAAAAQMATRVFDVLSKWTMLSDADLRAAILETGAPTPSAADLLQARRLFTRTVETPGGLKIQTIHAFCERLLHLFPFEANVPARFEVADDKRTQEMLSLAKRDVITAAQDAAKPLNAPLTQLIEVAGSKFDEVVGAAMRLRAAARGDETTQKTLSVRLGSTTDMTSAGIRRAMVEGGIHHSRWPDIAAVFDLGSANDRKQASRLRRASSLVVAGNAGLAGAVVEYLTLFFSEDLPRSGLMTKSLAKAHQDLSAELLSECTRLADLKAALRIAEAYERTEALVLLADAIIARYQDTKAATGVLDFDDLIERTVALLKRSDAGWVLHKLDAGIDHVLVDEAQDTSEAQWSILERLTSDFAAGHSARLQPRSFFVVGDDKQSIFSFQGAAPLMFNDMERQFTKRFRDGGKRFERVELKTSFRSVPGVLAAVDTIFGHAANQDGLVSTGHVWPLHESIKTRLPSLVEIWPRVSAKPMPEPDDWSIPLDKPNEQDPANIVAERVAKKIKSMVAHDSDEYVHDGRGEQRRPIRAGDILVLVRTRNAFFEAVIRALKANYVPVAGADRLDVANHIAVMDLVAVGRTALLPQDDLSLACLLKSPLFGLTDDDLIALAPRRRGALIEALASSPSPLHRAAHDKILEWSARSTETTPFGFYVELLGRDGGRKLLESRLGPEAHDAIDEFLRLALEYERREVPSLGAFLAEVAALDSSIKRDMEASGDAVRVMTVHAAKGLEAKIVFLPDTCGVPAQQFDPVVFDLNKGTQPPPLIVWSPRKADDPPVVAAAREAERQATMREYRRLLYVGLTRAEERLYIAGFFNVRRPPDDCWNAMIEGAFPEAQDVPAFWDGTESIKRITTPGTAAETLVPTRPPAGQHTLALTEEWLRRPVSSVLGGTRLRPSTAAGLVHSLERRRALAFGSAMHLLLQYLPDVAPEIRETAAFAFLAARPDLVAAASHATIVAEALGVMAMPALAPLFGTGAMAEVSVAGRIPQQDGTMREVSGTVDRLAVTGDSVIVADFKTGTPKPEVSVAYAAQLQLYRAALQPLWPDLPLRTLLVWTQEPRIVEIDVDGVAAKPAGSA